MLNYSIAQEGKKLMDALIKDENYNELFENRDFSNMEINDTIFEQCVFRNCTFIDTKILHSKIENTQFISCNMSNIDLTGSKLDSIEFEESKIIGLTLYKCNQINFDFVFNKSKLEYCNFSDVNMKKNIFLDCEIIESHFQNTFLVESVFKNVDFTHTSFFKCNLKKANFTDSIGYVIDPVTNNIEKATFSISGVLGLLHGFDIKIV